MRVAYFVHDLTDPAVGKRVKMLRAGGAEVRLLGFRREDRIPKEIEGAPTFDFGRTYDTRLRHRCMMLLKQLLGRRSWADEVRDCDILFARNLEMLALAAASRRYAPRDAHLIYECLDVHRLLLSRRLIGESLRLVERKLLRKANLLVVSSPAYLTEYFEPRQNLHRSWQIPILLVENKVLVLEAESRSERSGAAAQLPPGPPWRIGWFGMIRCQKSLDMLCDLVRQKPGVVEVIIRGRPSRVLFRDFDAQVKTPGISYGGGYAPGELGTLYRGIHLNWAIDLFEVNGNSELLLPNRIYEGGRHDAIPLALDRTETGRWLKMHGLGHVLKSAGELTEFFENLTAGRYGELKRASMNAPRDAFIADQCDCQHLVEALARTPAPHAAAAQSRNDTALRLTPH